MTLYGSTYPCDRGMPGNALNRGWHKFVAGPGGVVCEFCGKRSASDTPRVADDPSMGPDGVAREGQFE